MRISHKYKFVFLAFPRTGSTTVRKVLDQYADIKSVHVSQTSRRFPFYHHISAYELKKVFERRGWRWQEYNRFCVVRNPYDRVVSLYHHHKKLRDRAPNEKHLYERVRDRLVPTPSFRDYVLRLNPRTRLAAPFQKFIGDEAGDPLVDDIMIFEKLDSMLPRYLQSIGVRVGAGDIPHLNASTNRGNYRAYYDEATRRRVHDVYCATIKRFGYSF